MRSRLLRMLVITGVAVAAVAVPSTAHAGPPYSCPRVALETAYGPIKQCVEFAGALLGRLGFYSTLEGNFNPLTDWMGLVGSNSRSPRTITATDGITGDFWSTGDTFATAYGRAAWGTQTKLNSSYPYVTGRFGVANLETGLFYPSDVFRTVATVD